MVTLRKDGNGNYIARKRLPDDVPLLGAAFYMGRDNATIIAAGVVIWAVAEWMQHPIQMSRAGGKIVSSYKRRWSVFGTALDVIGIGLMILGAYRIWGVDIWELIRTLGSPQTPTPQGAPATSPRT
jgi:hypothetical protein